jgi:4-amino-4-deoxy-L-arabinose transferase-like glycosyltransferase
VTRVRRVDALPAAVAACTLAGFLLRLRGLDQSLWTDEFLTLGNVDGSISDVFHRLVSNRGTNSENNPPLYFVLAWASHQLGDSPSLIRLPSLVFGTATIPLAYLLGARTVGRAPGAIAAAFVAFSPFAVYYSDEGRAYATLAFLTTLSTLVLLHALERDGLGWWAAYALSVCAVVYTHNTGLFVLAAQAVWALWTHRERWRGVVGANVAAAIGFAPWIPHVHGRSLWVFDVQADNLHLRTVQSGLRLLGIPFVPVGEVPGAVALGLLALAVVLGVVGLARSGWGRDPSPLLLIALLAIATPLGLLAYRLLAHHNLLVFSRNLSASFVPAFLILGWLLTRPREPAVRAATLAVAGVALALIAVKNLDDRFERPPVNTVAHFLDARMTGRDTILYAGSGLGGAVLRDYLKRYLEHRHAEVGADPEGFGRALARGGRMYVTGLQSAAAPPVPPIAAARIHLVDRRFFPPNKPWLANPGLVVSIYGQ